MLRLWGHLAFFACCSVLGHMEAAHAEGKAAKSSKPAAAKAAAAKAAPSKALPEPIKPPPPGPPQDMPVCVRPKGVPEDLDKWGYDKAGKVLTQNLPQAVQQAGTRFVYIYDPKANPENVEFFPEPFNKTKCSGDAAPAAPPPKPAAIAALLGPSASGSGELPDRVRRFCSNSENYANSGTVARDQAQRFAADLRRAILKNEAMAPVTTSALSVEAATILADRFGETITAAIAYKRVIAPYNVQQKFRGGMSEPLWKTFPLVDTQWAAGQPDTVPTVLLRIAEHDSVTSAMKQHLNNITTAADAKTAYQTAYEGLSTWITAIQPYFPQNPVLVSDAKDADAKDE